MFHFRNPIQDWPRAIVQLPPGYVIKAVDDVQMLEEVKRVNPGIKTILRHWYTAQVPDSMPESMEAMANFFMAADKAKRRKMSTYANPRWWSSVTETAEFEWLEVPADTLEGNKQRARDFFDTFIDGTFLNYAHGVDYVEEWNEYFGNSQTPEEQGRFIQWAQAVAEVWATEYRTRPGLEHIRLILANTAIGNDIPIEVAQTAVDWDCLLGYHPYWPVKDNYTPDDEWYWYSGRWAAMDTEYRAQGITVEWAFTEAGAVRYWGEWPNISLDPMGGWKHTGTHDGDIGEYLNSIGRWMNEWADWNDTHDNRALPPVLFDSAFNGWPTFQIHQPDMDAIAQFVQQWQPEEPPAPPPPPPPPDRGKPRIQYDRVYNVIPQDATEERAIEIFRQGWNEARQTSGGSYDDSGIGDLDNRTAVLWDIPTHEHQTYIDWFASHYPGVHVIFSSWGSGDVAFFLGSPVDGIPLHVTDPFNAPRLRYPEWTNKLHEGLDLRAVNANGYPVPIVAVEDGIVYYAGNMRQSDPSEPSDYGNYVIVQHDNGLISWSAHLATMRVRAGDTVIAGDMLGLAGSTGNSTGIHLHLTIQWPGHGLSGYIVSDPVDPGPLLGL